MNYSTSLFELVKSLSREEKIYFKRFAKFHVKGKENKYLRLFDAIARQKKYDEKRLLKQFQNERFINNFPAAKSYLFGIIMKSLRNYHSGKSVESLLRAKLDEFDILISKGMYGTCYKILRKGRNMARRYERLDEWKLFLFRQARLMQYQLGKFSNDQLDEFFEEYFLALRKTNNYVEYLTLFFKSFHLVARHGSMPDKRVLKKLEKEMRHPMLLDETNAESKIARNLYYVTHMIHSSMTGDHQKEYYYNKKKVDLYKNDRECQREWPLEYLAMLGNLIRSLYYFPGKKEELKSIRALIEQIPDYNDLIKTKKFCMNYYASYFYHSFEYQYSEFVKQLRSFNEFLDDHYKYIMIIDRTAIQYNNAFVYFAIGEYSQSLYYLTPLINGKEFQYSKDVISYCHLLRLINHFELKNYDLTGYLASQSLRYFKEQRPEGFEVRTAKRFLKTGKITGNESRVEFLNTLESEISPMIKEEKDKYKMGFSIMTLLDWINATRQEMSYEKYKQKVKVPA